MQTILFLYNGECFKLPPFLTILDSLKEEFCIKVVSYETSENLKKIKDIYNNSNVEFLNVLRETPSNGLSTRIVRKVKHMLGCKTKYQIELEKKINDIHFDKLWVIHESTLKDVRSILANKQYIFSMYELNDTNKNLLHEIKESIQQAEIVIVPEYNRACILRVWCNLPKTPLVVPNKPLLHPRKKNILTDKLQNKNLGKIILYQGHIQPTRNLDVICEAVSSLSGYTLLLMGARSPYRDELQRKYANVEVIDFVNPPEHLYITSHAYIGIVKYDFVVLNAIFCAPNKTYEYAGFGIPMIGNNIPGLKYSIGSYNAGECVDLDDVSEVINAIKRIDENYNDYVKGANEFFDSVDIKSLLLKIVKN